jgi:hypothetical protein
MQPLRPRGLGRITLKKAYADGTIAVDMDPLSLLCRLATSEPPPRRHTIRYSGVPVDVLAGPECHGRMRLLAMVEDPPGRGPPLYYLRSRRETSFMGDSVLGRLQAPDVPVRETRRCRTEAAGWPGAGQGATPSPTAGHEPLERAALRP